MVSQVNAIKAPPYTRCFSAVEMGKSAKYHSPQNPVLKVAKY